MIAILTILKQRTEGKWSYTGASANPTRLKRCDMQPKKRNKHCLKVSTALRRTNDAEKRYQPCPPGAPIPALCQAEHDPNESSLNPEHCQPRSVATGSSLFPQSSSLSQKSSHSVGPFTPEVWASLSLRIWLLFLDPGFACEEPKALP